ncbi:unnamed protein product [Polarella glacialis]|uniref:Uncharacterized protein n=1 Tax=Polarella glacialis TaxID=89957 RepID=A0A813G7S8_POLGL|nr:unnamed protein product [Polarella glacialis]
MANSAAWVTTIAAPFLVWVSMESLQNPNSENTSEVIVAASAVASLSALWLAAWAAMQKNAMSALIAWAVAFLIAFVGDVANSSLRSWTQHLVLLDVACFTGMLFVSRQPSQWLWYVLPGLWVAAVGSSGASFSNSWTAAAVLGVALMVAPHLGLRAGEPEPHANLELVGMAWLAAGAVLGIYQVAGVAGQICAVLCVVIAGVVQLVMGLSWATRESWRRIAGLLSVSLGILLGAGATEGFIQSIILILGSLLAIALAVLVAAHSQRPQDAHGPGMELQGLMDSRSMLVADVEHVDQVL